METKTMWEIMQRFDDVWPHSWWHCFYLVLYIVCVKHVSRHLASIKRVHVPYLTPWEKTRNSSPIPPLSLNQMSLSFCEVSKKICIYHLSQLLHYQEKV